MKCTVELVLMEVIIGHGLANKRVLLDQLCARHHIIIIGVCECAYKRGQDDDVITNIQRVFAPYNKQVGRWEQQPLSSRVETLPYHWVLGNFTVLPSWRVNVSIE